MNLTHQQQTSAGSLAQQLTQLYHLPQADICSDHIGSVYAEMPQLDKAADFQTMPALSQATAHEIEPGLDVLGVIVETRSHPALETVVCNVVEQAQIPVQVFHGIDNLDFILSTKIKALVDSKQVFLSQINSRTLETQAYNALLLSEGFWNSLIGRNKILVFQSDSLCCQESHYQLSDFLEFDYIGASWNVARPVNLIINGGNGGFSLRDWNKTLACLQRFPAALWGGGEDGYYGFHMELIGAKVATPDESARFATQSYFTHPSFGAHAVRNLIPKEQKRFFAYCPLARQVFPHAYAEISQD